MEIQDLNVGVFQNGMVPESKRRLVGSKFELWKFFYSPSRDTVIPQTNTILSTFYRKEAFL